MCAGGSCSTCRMCHQAPAWCRFISSSLRCHWEGPSNVLPPARPCSLLGAAPQGSKGHGREVKATSHDSRVLLRAAHLVQPLTSRDRTLLGSSSSRVKMSPRFTVSWDPSSNSTCPGAQFSGWYPAPMTDSQGPTTQATAAQLPSRVLVQGIPTGPLMSPLIK